MGLPYAGRRGVQRFPNPEPLVFPLPGGRQSVFNRSGTLPTLRTKPETLRTSHSGAFLMHPRPEARTFVVPPHAMGGAPLPPHSSTRIDDSIRMKYLLASDAKVKSDPADRFIGNNLKTSLSVGSLGSVDAGDLVRTTTRHQRRPTTVATADAQGQEHAATHDRPVTAVADPSNPAAAFYPPSAFHLLFDAPKSYYRTSSSAYGSFASSTLPRLPNVTGHITQPLFLASGIGQKNA